MYIAVLQLRGNPGLLNWHLLFYKQNFKLVGNLINFLSFMWHHLLMVKRQIIKRELNNAEVFSYIIFIGSYIKTQI